MITSIHKHLIKLIEKEFDNSKSLWKIEDKFYRIKELSIDQRGRVGELFLKDIFKELNMKVDYVDNAHGDYDIIAEDIKIEVKLATLDVNKKFQHEGIKSNKLWDIVAFVDVAPENIYVTFINKYDFSFSDKKGTFILNGKERSSHYRGKDEVDKRATGAGYKVDFPKEELKETKTIKDFENSFHEEVKKLKEKSR